MTDLTVEAELLVPMGPIDMARQVMPTFRNQATGEIGALPEMCKKPGAMWQATWIPGQPWYARLTDDTITEVRPEDQS